MIPCLVRTLSDGFELDDDQARIDRVAMHGYLSGESYGPPAAAGTRDMHRLYAKLGFAPPDGRLMERRPTS